MIVDDSEVIHYDVFIIYLCVLVILKIKFCLECFTVFSTHAFMSCFQCFRNLQVKSFNDC